MPVLGIYLEKALFQKDAHTQMFVTALFPKAKTEKQPKCPSVDEWIKMWLHIQWNTPQPLKKE